MCTTVVEIFQNIHKRVEMKGVSGPIISNGEQSFSHFYIFKVKIFPLVWARVLLNTVIRIKNDTERTNN